MLTIFLSIAIYNVSATAYNTCQSPTPLTLMLEPMTETFAPMTETFAQYISQISESFKVGIFNNLSLFIHKSISMAMSDVVVSLGPLMTVIQISDDKNFNSSYKHWITEN